MVEQKYLRGAVLITAFLVCARVYAVEAFKPLVITGLGDAVSGLGVFDNGKRIAAGGNGGVIHIYDSQTGKEVQTLDGHNGHITSLAVSKDGSLLASASLDSTVRIWNLKTMKRIRVLTTPRAPITVDFSSDDSQLLVGEQVDNLQIFNVDTGAEVKKLKAGYVSAFAPDDRSFVAASYSAIKRLETESAKTIWSVKSPKSHPYRAKVTANGALLLVSVEEEGVLVLDMETGRQVRTMTLHGEGAHGLLISKDGKWALTGTRDGDIYQWEIESGKVIRKFQGHTRSVLGLAFWPDGQTFASGGTDGTVRTWRIDSNQIAKLDPGVAVAIPDKTQTASTGTGQPPVGVNLPKTVTSGPSSKPVASVPETSNAASDPIARPEFKEKPKPFKKNLASITSMVVRVAEDGSAMGLSTDIIATVPAKSRQEEDGSAQFVRRVGGQMQVSMEEAERAVKLRYPRWGGNVTLSFGEKYTEHDGGSAGAAFGVLMLSTLEGIDLDPKCAVTGDITVDWKIRKVSAVAAKLRGATVDGCLYALIPANNESALADMYLLWGDSSLWDIQTLTISTLQEAVELVRTDRPQATAEAMRLFGGLQPTLSKSGRSALRDANTISTLKRIVSLAPNHVSAKLLLAIGENHPPTALSTGASLYEISVIAYPYRQILSGRDRVTRASLPVAVTFNARKKIQRLRPVVNKDLALILNDLSAFIEKAEAVAGGQAKEAELSERRGTFFQHLSSMVDNKEILEKLVREGY